MPQNIKDRTLLEYFRNFAQCNYCYENCSKSSGTYLCKICNKWYHKVCVKKESTRSRNALVQQHHENSYSYACEKCVASYLPFFDSDDIDFKCALYGKGGYPCKKCKRDCIEGMNYFHCIVCNALYHSECTTIHNCTSSQLICSKKCYLALLPFYNYKYQELLDHEIFTKVKEKSKTSSSIATNNSSPIEKVKNKPTQCVPLDHFYNINCSYLSPNHLENSDLGDPISDLSIFQGNVRSLFRCCFFSSVLYISWLAIIIGQVILDNCFLN